MTALNVQQLALRTRVRSDEVMNFTVADGEIAALFGRPGSGIRTILRVLAGLESAPRGEVRVGDAPVQGLPPHQRRIGLVQRESALFPGTVADNVGFGLKRSDWPKSDRGRRISEVLELVGMTGAEGERADALTEGERARVVLARAIAPRPAALLVESPTWFVPEVDKISFRSRLREVFQALEVPVLISTHDVQDAIGIADHLHVVHDGLLKQSGSVSRVLAGPTSIEVAELVGYVTLIRGEVMDGSILEPGAGAIEFPPGFPLHGTARALGHPAVMLGVPESSGLGCGVAGTVERVRAIGPTHLLDLRVGERTIEVRWEWDLNPPDADEMIAIAVTPGTLRFFNEPNNARPAAAVIQNNVAPRPASPVEEAAGAPASTSASGASAPDPTDFTEDTTDPLATSTDEAAAPARAETEPAPEAEPESAPEDTPAVEGHVWARPRVEVQEFIPSAGLMAEPPPPREEAPTIAYDPEDTGARHDSSFIAGAASPAPAPPRMRPPGDEAEPSEEPHRQDDPAEVAQPTEAAAGETPSKDEEPEEDSVGLMAPWLQVSKPPRTDPQPPNAPDPHRGMPLD